MDPFEERLVSTMREHAGEQVDTAALLHGASATGRRLKRRRQILALAASATGVVAVMGIATTVVTGLPGTGPGGVPLAAGSPSQSHVEEPATGDSDGWTVLPTPPAATGEPTAVEKPRVVSEDGGLLHLSFDELPEPYRYVSYQVSPGFQHVGIWPAASNGNPIDVLLVNEPSRLPDRTGISSERVTVGEQPGRLYRLTAGDSLAVRWQPAPGLWLEAFESTPGRASPAPPSKDRLLAVAEQVRVDRVMRCVTPFQLGHAPEGVSLDSCHISFGVEGDPKGQLRLSGDDGRALSLHLVTMRAQERADQKPNMTVAGRPAYWMPQEPGNQNGHLVVYGIHQGEHLLLTVDGGYTKQDAIAVVENLQFAEDLTDPATWPTHPIK